MIYYLIMLDVYYKTVIKDIEYPIKDNTLQGGNSI